MLVLQNGVPKFGRYVIGDMTYYQHPMAETQSLAFINLVGTVISRQVNLGSSSDAVIDTIVESLTTTFLAEFLGIVILKDGQDIQELAKVQNFAERGQPVRGCTTGIRDGYDASVFSDLRRHRGIRRESGRSIRQVLDDGTEDIGSF